VLEYIEIGKREGKLACGGEQITVPGCPGYYVQPTIFSGIKKDHRLHCDEIFGPVLAFLKCKDFDEGLEIVNSTIYGLTGGVFSDRRENLEKARTHFHVGNLYLNRKCTGALVDVQPFGGFNMSGTDDKAGGREHLYRFMQAKTVCERF
jgi:1-pyrroline-5-carboxylate dehydrogenase